MAANEFWLLWVYGAPLLFASNVPLWFLLAALLTIPLFWIARRLTHGVWSIATPLDVPLAILLALGLVAVVVSNDRLWSARLYGELLGGIALYYGIVNGLARVGTKTRSASGDAHWTRQTRLARGVYFLLALGAGMAVFGVLGLRVTDKFLPLSVIYNALPQVDVSFLNPRGFTPNIVAGALAPLVPLAFAFAWMQQRKRRALALVIALLMASVIFLTQSRGALLGLALGFGVMLLWRVPRAGWLILIALLLGGSFLILNPMRDVGALLFDDSANTVKGRIELWERALFILRDFPFTGIGLGAFESNVLVLYPLFENTPGEPIPHAHNLYLQMGADYGVGGFIAFLALVTTTLGVGIHNARRLRATREGWLAIGLLASVVAFLGHGLLDAIFSSTKVSVDVWMIVGMMMVVGRENE